MNDGSGVLKSLLGWVPNWVGFGLIILAGIIAIVVGVVDSTGPRAGFIAFGVAAIASSIIAWVDGARSTPQVNPFEPSFGGSVERIETWAWLIIFGLFLVAAIVAIVTR